MAVCRSSDPVQTCTPSTPNRAPHHTVKMLADATSSLILALMMHQQISAAQNGHSAVSSYAMIVRELPHHPSAREANADASALIDSLTASTCALPTSDSALASSVR